MDRRSSFSYPRRSKPQRNYADYYADDPVLPPSDDEINDNNNDDNNTSDEDYRGHRFRHGIPSRHPRKQRKLSTITAGTAAAPSTTAAASAASNYRHFTPPAALPPSTWSEQATFVLLEIWGDRFLQLGRTSLRSEDWKEVAERVSQAARSKRTVSECRNRLNVLKEKYKREKAKWGVLGSSKWVFYKKMDGLMTMSPRQLQQQELCGLACGLDSGEFVFMNPRVYLDHSNALDEMRDSPGNSECEGANDEDEEGSNESDESGESDDDEEEGEVEAEESYRMLSDSIKRVGEIYEKIEGSKRSHMMELERMRVEFQRDLEVQKKEMVDQTRAEIAKLSQTGSDCDDVDNVSE